MTLTTEVRIDWPVPAIALLDHVTRVAGGDPATVRRRVEKDRTWNLPGQGLMTLADVMWSEDRHVGYMDEDDPADNQPMPPSLVRLSVDNPYGAPHRGPSGRNVQATVILPAVAEWLDDQGVPRDRWWWEDETAGTFHPGTTDPRHLATNEPREVWTAEVPA